MTVTDIRTHREALVREHMESENVHDFDATIGTSSHPRYEIVPTGEFNLPHARDLRLRCRQDRV